MPFRGRGGTSLESLEFLESPESRIVSSESLESLEIENLGTFLESLQHLVLHISESLLVWQESRESSKGFIENLHFCESLKCAESLESVEQQW